MPCQKGPEDGWLLMWTKAFCLCVERVVCSGALIVIWKYPAIEDNWLRNILQLSIIFLFSQMVVPLGMVSAPRCAATFPFTVLVRVNSTSSWWFFLLWLPAPLQEDSQAHQLCPSLPCSLSLGVIFGWSGVTGLIRLTSVLYFIVVRLH